MERTSPREIIMEGVSLREIIIESLPSWLNLALREGNNYGRNIHEVNNYGRPFFLVEPGPS